MSGILCSKEGSTGAPPEERGHFPSVDSAVGSEHNYLAPIADLVLSRSQEFAVAGITAARGVCQVYCVRRRGPLVHPQRSGGIFRLWTVLLEANTTNSRPLPTWCSAARRSLLLRGSLQLEGCVRYIVFEPDGPTKIILREMLTAKIDRC